MAAAAREEPSPASLKKRQRQTSKRKVKKALVLPPPLPPIGQKAFICEGTSCDLVRRVLLHWGWTERPAEKPAACQLKWTFRSRDAEKPLEPWQLINHFHGSYYLSNKAFLGQCLRCCPCCYRFFPRQYDLRDAFGMRCFLRDYILTAAHHVLHAPSAPSSQSGLSRLNPKEVAARVLRRHKEWSQGHPDRPERLLRCPHEMAALLGTGCLLPRKISMHQRVHVDVFLSRLMMAECVACQEDPKPLGGESHPYLQHLVDGPQNIWALKEPCVQKGKGVTVLSGLPELLEDYEQHRAVGQGRDCVAQKYIERPLLVNQPHGLSKCDLRVWVLVLDWNPLTAFVHPEVYFRIATRPFQFESLEPNAHKTNCRDAENRVPMKVLLEQLGCQGRWDTCTWPRLLDAVRASLFATRCSMAPHLRAAAKAFELFGLDFGLDENWQPWLLEINTSPCMLDDCKGEFEEEIKSWAWEATESLLKLVLAAHDGSWKLPSYLDLQNIEAPGVVERLFDDVEVQHSPCLAQMVKAVPSCLASGLSLEGPCGRWRLVLREKALEESSLRQAHEALQRRIFQGVSAKETSVSKLLREWLLPSEEEPAQVRNMSKTCPKSLKRSTSQPGLRTEGNANPAFRTLQVKSGTLQL